MHTLLHTFGHLFSGKKVEIYCLLNPFYAFKKFFTVFCCIIIPMHVCCVYMNYGRTDCNDCMCTLCLFPGQSGSMHTK